MSSRQDPPDEPMVARDATYYRAPDALRTRIRAAIAAQAQAQASAAPRRRPGWGWQWAGFATAFAAVGALSWNLAWMQARSDGEERLAQEVASAHVRSLMMDSHLNDVISTDRHTVKPWFEGKLDFAPDVQDLSACGFPLIGGRLDYVNGRPVAALTYRRRLHVINVFEWPASDAAAAPRELGFKGYALERWRKGGLQYWAVSDVAPEELRQLTDCLARS
jgi:anti-sigma factor RsiW